MTVVLMGDSITEMNRAATNFQWDSYGNGYPFFIEGELASKYPKRYSVYNRGIGGHRVVDIYARIKAECWNLNPDVISVLIGVNDVWAELLWGNGVEIDRYERFYRMYIEETKKVLPNVRFMLLEPFVLKGTATEKDWECFQKVKEYAKVVKRLAREYDCIFVPLQDKLDKLAEKYGAEQWLFDGVHTTVAGAKVIADAWLQAFYKL